MANQFEVTYYNDDGYVGSGSAPYHVRIRENDLSGDETEQDLREMFWDTLNENFDNNHRNLYSDQESEFVEWALAANKAAQEEE